MRQITEITYAVHKCCIGYRIDIDLKSTAPDGVPCALPFTYSKRLYLGGIRRAIRKAMRIVEDERQKEARRHAPPMASGTG